MQTISYFRLKSFLIHVSPSFYILYCLVFQITKGVCGRQCDFINKFCLPSENRSKKIEVTFLVSRMILDIMPKH